MYELLSDSAEDEEMASVVYEFMHLNAVQNGNRALLDPRKI